MTEPSNLEPNNEEDDELALLSAELFATDMENNDPDDFEAQQQLPGRAESKSNSTMAFMNMSNSILGAGIIGQPYAMKNCGIFTGVFLYVLLTVLVDWTIRLIIINCKLSGTKTFQDTGYKCFGKPGKFIILLSQLFFAVGGLIAFCIIIGDTVPHVLYHLFGVNIDRNWIIAALTIFVSYPLSLIKNISKLAISSLFALLNMLMIILIIVIHGFKVFSVSKSQFSNSFQGYFFNTSFCQGISVISFALVCHHNTSFIYDSLKKPTLDRFEKITHWSCFISMICCSLIGVLGDLMFKNDTKGNILNNFSSDDWIINVARFSFGLNMLTTLPLEIFVVRQVVYDLLDLFRYPNNDESSKDDYMVEYNQLEMEDLSSETTANNNRSNTAKNLSGRHKVSALKHLVITTVIVFFTMGVSLTTCNLGATLEIIGSISALIMAFIFPCACNLKLTDYKQKLLKQNLPSYFTIAFGSCVLVISTLQTLLTMTNDEGHC